MITNNLLVKSRSGINRKYKMTIVVTAATFLLMLMLLTPSMMQLSSSNTTPLGILNLQLSATSYQAQQIRSAWEQTHIATPGLLTGSGTLASAASINTIFDCFNVLAYGALLWAINRWVNRRNTVKKNRVTLLISTACAADQLENIGTFLYLSHHDAAHMLIFLPAIIKYLLLSVVILLGFNLIPFPLGPKTGA